MHSFNLLSIQQDDDGYKKNSRIDFGTHIHTQNIIIIYMWVIYDFFLFLKTTENQRNFFYYYLITDKCEIMRVVKKHEMSFL